MQPDEPVLEPLDAIELEIEHRERRGELLDRGLVDLRSVGEWKEDRHVRGHAQRRRPVVGEPKRADGGFGLRDCDDQGRAWHARPQE